MHPLIGMTQEVLLSVEKVQENQKTFSYDLRKAFTCTIKQEFSLPVTTLAGMNTDASTSNLSAQYARKISNLLLLRPREILLEKNC